MTKPTLRAALSPIALLAASACMSVSATEPATASAPAQPDEAAIIAERIAAARSAGITDMEAYAPVVRLPSCDGAGADPLGDASAFPGLEAALAKAQSYSDAQNGKGLLVMVDGEIVHEGFADGVSSTTPFVSQSLHKTLLAMVVMHAVDEGVIASLDDPIGRYLQGWADDPRGRITVRQAMQMASGLELYSMATGDARALAMNFGTHLDKAAMGSALTDAPGELFAYNNANAQLVGAALRSALTKAGKGSYEDYLAAKVWCPAGADGGGLRYDREGGSPQFFAGVHASLFDWAFVGEALRKDEGGVYAPLSKASPANPNYGLFTWIGAPADGQRRYSAGNPLFIPHSAPYEANDMIFMDGFGGQRVYVSREHKLVIARFGEVSFTYDDAIIANLIVSALKGEGAGDD
ncbi:MAG: serine hydrolase [Pseudomonadota bacterium]